MGPILFKLFLLSTIGFTLADITRTHTSSSTSSSSSLTRSGSSDLRKPAIPTFHAGQTQQTKEYDDYDLSGQKQQLQETDLDDVWNFQDQHHQKKPPAKVLIRVPTTVKPLSANLVASSCGDSIKTSNGLVRGKLVKNTAGKEVCVFYGIPFAKPPIDELRFKRPVPYGNWEGTLDATKLPNSCYQSIQGLSPESVWYPNTKLSEDCLYLNIWVPATILKNKASASAAVMIWIYGGGFISGTGTLDFYNGANMAGDHDVIVANMQYRVGAFGFLYFGCNEVEGNSGLLDQNLAIQWIKENVGNFGGNSAEITLFGESAGAISTSYHLISPLSKHLIKRAIIMSGTAIIPGIYRTPSQAVDFSYEVAEAVGCWSPSSFEIQNVSDVINCLKKTSAGKLVDFPYKHKMFLDLPMAITTDGYFLPDSPDNLLKNPDNGGRIDIIIGNDGQEGSLFLTWDYPKYFSTDRSKTPVISSDIFQTTIRHMFRDKSVIEQEAIASRYTNWKNVDDTNENLKRIVDAAGDGVFVCSSVDFAKKWAARGLRVYYYYFTRPSIATLPAWMGAVHGDDVEFVFGNLMSQPDRPKGEKDLSRNMQQLFANFAKKGVPSANWGLFTPAYPIYLDLNNTIISDQTPSNNFGPRAEHCAFWNNELPRLKDCSSLTIQNPPRSTPVICANLKAKGTKEKEYHFHKSNKYEASSGGFQGGNQIEPNQFPNSNACVMHNIKN